MQRDRKGICMAKKRSVPSPKAEQPHFPVSKSQDVEAGLERLQAYYAMGCESLRSNPDRVPYRESSEKLRKARVFASRFSEQNVAKMKTLCRKHGFVMGTSLIDRLATVHDRRARRKLLEKTISLRWSKIKLDREIRLRFGRRRKLGRNPHKPEDIDEALSEIVRISIKLTRFGEGLGWNVKTGRIELTVETDITSRLPSKVLDELKKTLRAAYRLQDAAEAELLDRR